jgi:hypothetical protein
LLRRSLCQFALTKLQEISTTQTDLSSVEDLEKHFQIFSGSRWFFAYVALLGSSRVSSVVSSVSPYHQYVVPLKILHDQEDIKVRWFIPEYSFYMNQNQFLRSTNLFLIKQSPATWRLFSFIQEKYSMLLLDKFIVEIDAVL